MKRLLVTMLCIFFIANISACSFIRSNDNSHTDPTVETSIVYVYVNEPSSNSTDYTLPYESPSNTRSTEPTETTEEIALTDDEIIDNAIAACEELLSVEDPNERDYDAAYDILIEANRLVSDNTRLLEEQSRITNLMPVSLLNCNMLGGDPSIYGSQEISTGEIVSCIGYSIMDISAGETLRTRTGLSYMTEGYDTFTCSLAFINDASKNSPMQHYIEVYVDGMLVYTSPYLTAGSPPIDISVDISNSSNIEIKFCCNNTLNEDWLASMWCYETYYEIGWVIVDPYFYPEYTPYIN